MKNLLIVFLLGLHSPVFSQDINIEVREITIKKLLNVIKCKNTSDIETCFIHISKFIGKKGYQISGQVDNYGLFYSGGFGRGITLYRENPLKIEIETSYEKESLGWINQLKEEKFELISSSSSNDLLEVVSNTYTNPKYPKITIIESQIEYSKSEVNYQLLVIREM